MSSVEPNLVFDFLAPRLQTQHPGSRKQMNLDFECSREDLVGAHLAGLGEDPKIKIRRFVFILLPLMLMVGVAVILPRLFSLGSPNTALVPAVLLCLAVLYGWAVKSNRHLRAKAAVAEHLRRSGESLFGRYQVEVQDQGLLITHNGSRFWKWTEISSILANADYCRIDIPGQESIIIAARKTGSHELFVLFVRLCNTLHFCAQRESRQQSERVSPEGDVWEAAFEKPLSVERTLRMLENESPSERRKNGPK